MIQLLADAAYQRTGIPDAGRALDNAVQYGVRDKRDNTIYASGDVFDKNGVHTTTRKEDDYEEWGRKILEKMDEWLKDKMKNLVKELLYSFGQRLLMMLIGLFSGFLLSGYDDIVAWARSFSKKKKRRFMSLPSYDLPSPSQPDPGHHSPPPPSPPPSPPPAPSPVGLSYVTPNYWNGGVDNSTIALPTGMSVYSLPGYSPSNGSITSPSWNQPYLAYDAGTSTWTHDSSGVLGANHGLFEAWGGQGPPPDPTDSQFQSTLPAWSNPYAVDPAIWSTVNGQYVYWQAIQSLNLRTPGSTTPHGAPVSGSDANLPAALSSAASGPNGTIIVPASMRYTPPSGASAPTPNP
jgi:hypothetical protein